MYNLFSTAYYIIVVVVQSLPAEIAYTRAGGTIIIIIACENIYEY